MKFVCLGFYDEKAWGEIPLEQQNSFMDDCFAYDDVLREKGHVLGGEALQSVQSAATLRWKDGKVSVTDGPFAETKEQLGGFFIFEARNMEHAVELISKHPGLKAGPMEIRPVEDMTEILQASARRRAASRRTAEKP